MTARFNIDIDRHMFDVANERPFVWKYIFLNEYMRTGTDWLGYFSLFLKNPRENIQKLQGRHISNLNAPDTVTQFCMKHNWSVRDCRTVVINLCLILEHLKGLLEENNIENTEVVKPEMMEAVRVGLFGVVSQIVAMSYAQLVTQAEIDEENGAITQILKLFRTEKIFPQHVDMGQTHNLLFMSSRGNRLEQKNPCEILQNIFKAALKQLDTKVSPEKFIVPELSKTWPSMCTAHQCCRTVFTESSLTEQKIDKSLFASRGIMELAADKPVAVLEEQDGPYPSILLNAVRADLLTILKCSGLNNRNEKGQWDISPYEWKQAFLALPTDDTVLVPLRNYRLIQAMGEKVHNALNPGDTEAHAFPETLYQLPVIGSVKSEVQDVAPKQKKQVKFATENPVEMEATPKDNTLSIALIVIAAGLVALQLRR